MDFEVGIDTLQIEATDPENSAYFAASAELEEDTEAGVTRLIIHYEASPDTANPVDNRISQVAIRATGVTWDDITFVGDNIPPILVPV